MKEQKSCLSASHHAMLSFEKKHGAKAVIFLIFCIIAMFGVGVWFGTHPYPGDLEQRATLLQTLGWLTVVLTMTTAYGLIRLDKIKKQKGDK